METARVDTAIRLRSGRQLGYAEYGRRDGWPVMFFHGFPGSRYEGRLLDTAARRWGLRVIAPDRPGFGLSDFKPGRRMTSWPVDVAELADRLGVASWSVLGFSGGGPYAAVCAQRLPHRLYKAGILSGMGPTDAPSGSQGMRLFGQLELALARRSPAMAAYLYRLAYWSIRRRPARLRRLVSGRLPEPDRAVLEEPEVARVVEESFAESARQGTRGGEWELTLLGSPWGFRLSTIRADVQLWHGELDITVPPAMARYVADTIPYCRATFYRHEGHFSLARRWMEEILGALRPGGYQL
jgi:pimeloyl-ACP methyl ester carboxylesterase